jgi:hypothetical protein
MSAVVVFLFAVNILGLVALAAALGAAAVYGRKSREEIAATRRDLDAAVRLCVEKARECGSERARIDQIQSDVAGLKMGAQSRF